MSCCNENKRELLAEKLFYTAGLDDWGVANDDEKEEWYDQADVALKTVGSGGNCCSSSGSDHNAVDRTAAHASEHEQLLSLVGEGIHTSLRRFGDSKEADTAWEAISDMEEWVSVVKAVVDEIQEAGYRRCACG